MKVKLAPNPDGFSLDWTVADAGFVRAGFVVDETGHRVARFGQRSLDGTTPDGHLVFAPLGGTSVLDALYLVSVLLFEGHHGNAFLHRDHDWDVVDERSGRHLDVPHPPRIETVRALLGRRSAETRIRFLLEACALAVPVWTGWAASADLTYYDGIMSMDAVPQDLAEATLEAGRRWLDDGDPASLERAVSAYRALHWPMLEDELVLPPNVYYSAFAARNMASCALSGGDLDDALTCVQQALAARATDAHDTFLGEPFRRAFLLQWWRACLGVLLPS